MNRRMLLAAAGVVLGGAVIAVLLLSGAAPIVLRFEPLGPALAATDFAERADVATGYRRLGAVLPPSPVIENAELGEDGTVALALTVPARLIVWKRGAWRAFSLAGQPRVSRLGVDPEGVVYVGYDDGSFGVVRPGAPLVHETGAPSAGFSVEGFAFDRATKKSAVLCAAGRVYTGLRPLTAGALHAAQLPETASVRALAYAPDSQLVLAGDAGAVFVSSRDGWVEARLPTAAAVAALGVDDRGALLAAQANGMVFRLSGTNWRQAAQAQGTPIAVGFVRGGALAVLTSDFGLYVADESGQLAPVSGWVRPGGAVAYRGRLFGAAIAYSRDRLRVFDGVAWDGASEALEGAPRGSCEARGLPSRALPGEPPALVACAGVLHTISEDGVARAQGVRLGERDVDAAALVAAIEGEPPGRIVLAGGRLLRPSPRRALPSIHAWVASPPSWEPVVPLPVEDAPIRAVGALPDGSERWSLGEGPALRVAIGDAPPAAVSDAARLAVVAPAPSEAAVGAQVERVAIEPLGDGALLVSWQTASSDALARVARDGSVEPLVLEAPRGALRQVVRAGARVLVALETVLLEVRASGQPVLWVLPEGARVPLTQPFELAARADGTFAVLALLAGETALLECKSERCARRSLPGDVVPAALLVAGGGALAIVEETGAIGWLPGAP